MAESGDTVIIAALVSRVEALCVASMLEANGIAVQIDGNYHASVEINSLTLGGHRLRIAQVDYQAASDLIREVGTADNWQFCKGLRKAVIRLIIFYFAVFVVPFGFVNFIETREPLSPLFMVLTVLNLRVNPQGEGDYYLAPPAKA